MERCSVVLVALALLPIAACAPVPTPAPEIVAPFPKEYTCEEEAKAAAEFMALPPDSELAVHESDYSIERKGLRALHGMPDPAPCPRK